MEQYKTYLRNLQKEVEKKNRDYKKHVEMKIYPAIQEIALGNCSIQYVFLFGSFADDTFNIYSDIDIYMEGLESKDYYATKRRLEDMLDIGIDLYNQNDAPEFIEKIKRRGVLVYEREN